MAGPFLPVWSLSRSQTIRFGSAQGGTTGFGALNIPSGLAVGAATSGGNLTAGTYFYKITATNGRGGETKPCAEVSGTTASSNLTLPVTWNAVQGAAGYNVYRGATGAEVYLTSVNTNSFTDVGAITAAAGALSPPSTDTSGLGGRITPQLTQNPSTAVLPLPALVDLSDGVSRRDLGHHIAIGNAVPATPLRLTNSLPANTAAITTTATVVNLLQLPAYVLNVGSSLRVSVQGVTSATGNVTILSKLGTTGTTADTTLNTQTAPGATGGGGFEWNQITTVQAVGSGTNGKVLPNSQFSAHSTSPAITNNVAQVSVDTTIPQYLSVVISVSAGNVVVTNSLIEFLDASF